MNKVTYDLHTKRPSASADSSPSPVKRLKEVSVSPQPSFSFADPPPSSSSAQLRLSVWDSPESLGSGDRQVLSPKHSHCKCTPPQPKRTHVPKRLSSPKHLAPAALSQAPAHFRLTPTSDRSTPASKHWPSSPTRPPSSPRGNSSLAPIKRQLDDLLNFMNKKKTVLKAEKSALSPLWSEEEEADHGPWTLARLLLPSLLRSSLRGGTISMPLEKLLPCRTSLAWSTLLTVLLLPLRRSFSPLQN